MKDSIIKTHLLAGWHNWNSCITPILNYISFMNCGSLYWLWRAGLLCNVSGGFPKSYTPVWKQFHGIYLQSKLEVLVQFLCSVLNVLEVCEQFLMLHYNILNLYRPTTTHIFASRTHPPEDILYIYIFTIIQFHRYLEVKNGDMEKWMILTNNAIGAFTNPVQFLKFRYKATPAQLGWEEERKKE